ncbi:hypothetical protein [Nocardioides houyundeii]|uniref:hypothetical protein n=1 Tax=Nocardioides houyundeii TaxID=2045452 RepID=UPI000C78D4D9|nr:hypothetical protein [Nocardioides houyundeii]
MPLPSRSRLRLATGLALSCLVLGTLASCGDDVDTTPGSEGGSTSTPTSSQTQEQEPAPIEITLEQDSFEPKGERIEVAAGEPVKIVITADRAGELHVHSTPEQEIEFTAGVTEHEVTIDQPGVVEVESHDPALVVLQLEVR